MPRININGAIATLTSTLELDGIKELMKLNPEALTVFEVDEDGKKDPVFKVTAGEVDSIGNFGVCFAGKNRAGQAVISRTIGNIEDDEELEDLITSLFMKPFEYIHTLEETAPAALEEVKNKRRTFMEAVTIE